MAYGSATAHRTRRELLNSAGGLKVAHVPIAAPRPRSAMGGRDRAPTPTSGACAAEAGKVKKALALPRERSPLLPTSTTAELGLPDVVMEGQF